MKEPAVSSFMSCTQQPFRRALQLLSFTPVQFICPPIAILCYYSDCCEYKGFSSSRDTPLYSLEDLYIRLQRFNSESTWVVHILIKMR